MADIRSVTPEEIRLYHLGRNRLRFHRQVAGFLARQLLWGMRISPLFPLVYGLRYGEKDSLGDDLPEEVDDVRCY